MKKMRKITKSQNKIKVNKKVKWKNKIGIKHILKRWPRTLKKPIVTVDMMLVINRKKKT